MSFPVPLPKPGTPATLQSTDTQLAQYAAIIASVSDAIVSVDSQLRILLLNPSAELMFGRTQASVLGEPLDLLLPLSVRPVHRKHIHAFDRSGEPIRPMGEHIALTALHNDGTEFPIEATISQVGVGRQKIFTAIVRNVSERNRAELSAEKRAGQLRILNSIHQAILAAPTPEAIAQSVLRHIPELLAYPQSSVLLQHTHDNALVVLAANLKLNAHIKPGRRFEAEGFAPGGADSRSESTNQVSFISDTHQVSLSAELRHVLDDEGIRAVLSVPLLVAEKRIGVLNLYGDEPKTPTETEIEMALQLAGILAVALQQASSRHTLNTTRERLHALTHRQLDLEEIQRRNISRDLHDMVGQNLTALNINLHAIGLKLPADTPATVRTRLEESSQLVEEIVERIRGLMAELRPSILDDLGLSSALRWYATEFSKRSELVCQVKAAELQTRLPQAAETALFRIAQEALTNIAKHAHAHRIWIELREQPAKVILIISDDGSGFDFEAMRQDPRKTGVGLVDMRERAEAIGGGIWIECEPGMGTQVKVEVPK